MKFIVLILLFFSFCADAQIDPFDSLRKITKNNTSIVTSTFDTLVKFTVSGVDGGRIEHCRFLTISFAKKGTVVQCKAAYPENRDFLVTYYFNNGEFILEQRDDLRNGDITYSRVQRGPISYRIIDMIKKIEAKMKLRKLQRRGILKVFNGYLSVTKKLWGVNETVRY